MPRCRRRNWCSILFSVCAKPCVSSPGYYGIRHNDDWIDEILANLDLDGQGRDQHAPVVGRHEAAGTGRAGARASPSPVIVLDEPTAGVDVELRQTLWAIHSASESRRTYDYPDHALSGRGRGFVWADRHAQAGAGRGVGYNTNLLARFSGHTLNLRLQPGAVLPASLIARRPLSMVGGPSVSPASRRSSLFWLVCVKAAVRWRIFSWRRPISKTFRPPHAGGDIMTSFRTLFYKEALRFRKVAFQTIAAPVLTALLYLLIFCTCLMLRLRSTACATPLS